MENEEQKEEEKPEEEKPEEEKTTELIDKADQTAKRLEEANKKQEELLNKQEKLLVKQRLGGTAEAGEVALPPKKLTDTEYAEALQRGEVNPLKEDGFL